ncbi:putative histone deacetylase complex subunit cti6 [Spathaspora sp. JA1]|nr:putative histone deacetylase complex subunit cti6 [Spathaspora sp. JA1]
MSRRSGRKPEPSNFPEELEEELEDLEEDSLEEAEEITRCICGLDELATSTINKELQDLLVKEYKIKIDHGLFIQCDKCGVWQHGYCVGLFDNNDVPEKYWCELCKPEVHIFIENNKRTLYKPINDKRKKIEQLTKRKSNSGGSSSRNSPPISKRKRHHHEEGEYDYETALQQALRESAQESGVAMEKGESPRKRGTNSPKVEVDAVVEEEVEVEEELLAPVPAPVVVETKIESDIDTSNIDEESDTSTKRTRGGRIGKSKKKKKEVAPDPIISEDHQVSKPRFVSSKSSIYELRKRTGAILEWLGRSQLELQDEKDRKLQLFNFTSIQDESVQVKFNENLELMENLTNQILVWEQKFGKYESS